MEDLLSAVPKKNGLPAKSAGQSLLEVIIATGMIILIVGGLVSAVISAMRNAQFAQNQSLATKYANEGLEKIRAYRDQSVDWVTFTAGCNGYDPVAVPTPFTRTVSCTDTSQADANKKIVTVIVSWSDPSGTHQSQLSSYFSNPALWK